MIWDVGQGLGCFFLLSPGFVLDNEIFLRMHPVIFHTLGNTKALNLHWAKHLFSGVPFIFDISSKVLSSFEIREIKSLTFD